MNQSVLIAGTAVIGAERQNTPSGNGTIILDFTSNWLRKLFNKAKQPSSQLLFPWLHNYFPRCVTTQIISSIIKSKGYRKANRLREVSLSAQG